MGKRIGGSHEWPRWPTVSSRAAYPSPPRFQEKNVLFHMNINLLGLKRSGSPNFQVPDAAGLDFQTQ